MGWVLGRRGAGDNWHCGLLGWVMQGAPWQPGSLGADGMRDDDVSGSSPLTHRRMVPELVIYASVCVFEPPTQQ